MAKTIRVSEEYHAVLKAHNREGETMEETLRRLTGGPSPEVLEELVADGGSDVSEKFRAAIEQQRERGRERRADIRERFE